MLVLTTPIKVVAFDLVSGSKAWTYFTDGPVRFPPVAWKDRIFCVSDDGYLYCISAESGQLIWKVCGGPSDRKALGNKRLISAWPARGGAVVADDVVYFAASIWPFMGTFVYAIDPEDGQVIWVNDSTSADYIKQPHSAPSFAGVAPQGTLCVSGDNLIVPGGRSVPAVFDRQSGKLRYFEINAGGKGTGGSFVVAHRDEFYVHTRRRGVRGHDLANGRKTAFQINEPVLTDELAFSAGTGWPAVCRCVHGMFMMWTTPPASRVVWDVPVDGSGDLILAGTRLYCAGKDSIATLQLAEDVRQAPIVCESLAVDGEVLRLLAGSEHLVAVTLDGRIHVFGADAPVTPEEPGDTVPESNSEQGSLAETLLEDIGVKSGYVVWYGEETVGRIAALLNKSNLNVVAIHPDPDVVEQQRQVFDAAGMYGKRVSVHVGTPEVVSGASIHRKCGSHQ